jgi:hypothetical protein
MTFQKKTPAPAAVEEKQSVITTATMTPEEVAIAQLVASQDDSWSTIDERSIFDYSIGKDAFELPEPARKLEQKKQFKFRWITRSPERLRQITAKEPPLKWWPVNRVQPSSGAFDRFIDVTGCVPREDQMLVFKPWWMFEKERAFKQGLADNTDASGDLTRKHGSKKGGLEHQAGKRSEGDRAMGFEISGSDTIVGDESTWDKSGEDVSDMTIE